MDGLTKHWAHEAFLDPDPWHSPAGEFYYRTLRNKFRRPTGRGLNRHWGISVSARPAGLHGPMDAVTVSSRAATRKLSGQLSGQLKRQDRDGLPSDKRPTRPESVRGVCGQARESALFFERAYLSIKQPLVLGNLNGTRPFKLE
jgi:hypothetical protein